MATQTVEFQAVTGQSVTAKLFAVGSDTQVASVSATEATNRKGTYSAAYTDVVAGTYDLIAFIATTPVARWQVVLTLTTATFQAYEPIATGPVAYAVWDEPMADHTGSTTYGGRIVRASNSNVTVQITGSNHISADVHAFQTDVIDATAFASSAVAEIQSGLATSTALTSVASDVTGIKAKTDNLPADPADASDIAASFASISSTLSTIASYIDTEVSAIKAKTDALPSDPADQSAVEAAITAATSVLATAASLATVASELAKVHKQGETRRFTQVARDALNKTADVTMGAPL